MPAIDSPAVLVARFLKANHYSETLDVYLREAGLPSEAADVPKGSFTIEKLLDEKWAYDANAAYEKLGTNDGKEKGWSAGGKHKQSSKMVRYLIQAAPSQPTIVSTLPSSSNILHVSFESPGLLIVSTSDRRISTLLLEDLSLMYSTATLQDSPILSSAYWDVDIILTTSMSGQLVLSKGRLEPMGSRRDHAKYAVKVIVHENSPDSPIWIATAGWDAKVNIYKVDDEVALPAPSRTILLASNPESLVFVQHPDLPPDSDPILVVTRRDSSSLHYYSTSPPTASDSESQSRPLGSQNLAPHSNAWVAFTPAAIALSPTDPTLLAVATSSMPHMKLLIVRLLIPLPSSSLTEPTAPSLPPASSAFSTFSALSDEPAASAEAARRARAETALRDREAAAVLVHVSTLAPQTAYSTPALAWRPDGSGVWVNGDDGVVRGLEASTGKVVVKLGGVGGAAGAHEPGAKIRCVAAGWVEGEEWLASGGFDTRLVVWRPEKGGG